MTDDIKHSISQRILQSEKGERCIRREGTNFEKPVFPGISEESLELADYVGQVSWAFFRILGLKADFLHVPVAVWPSREEYVQGKEVVANLAVVNDAAERGVKLCHDFLTTSKSESDLQHILQVVENCRGIGGNGS